MGTKFVATVSIPGYSPMDDDPPAFDTAKAAWAWLAAVRERDEDNDLEVSEYTETVTYLRYNAGDEVEYGSPHEDWPLAVDGTGVVYGNTPGYDGTHDLGLAYCVTAQESDTDD